MLAFLSLALLLTLPVHAAEWPDLSAPPPASREGAKDAALVVGIGSYAAAQPIPGARDNALAWVSWLQARGVPLVKPLLDRQAVKEELLAAARQVASKVQPGGTLWLVYIGHGAPAREGDDGLLVGWDAQQTASSIEARGLSQAALVAELEAVLPTGARAVVVLDACFSGKTAAGDLAPGLAPMKPVSARVGSSRVTVLTAAAGNEYAGPLSDGSRPAFSYLALGALRGWGDGDGDGTVRASEVHAYVERALLQTVTGRSQTPSLDGPDLALARGREAGPDLVGLAVRGTAAPVTAGVATIDLGGGETDFASLAARAQAAEQAKRQAEAAAAAAAALEREERRQLDAAAATVRSQASRDFAALKALVEAPSEAGKPVLEAYVARYGSAKVTVGARSEAVDVPEVAKVRAALAVVVSPAAVVAPTGVVAPATGRAGEQVVTKSGMKMRVIPAGTFTMGCTPGAGECEDDEKPAHKVTLTRSFLLGETEVTQGQWLAVMGSNPSVFSSCGSDCPVENVSWLDVVAFANALSKKEGLEACYVVSGETASWPKGAACTGYRLPTEAEWEYAARAGKDSRYSGGSELGAVGWFTDNADGKTHRVAQKQANAWGLFDMSGNVWEWSWDWYGAFSASALTDPVGASDGLFRVFRGGCWRSAARGARLAFRNSYSPGFRNRDLGLRLARSIP